MEYKGLKALKYVIRDILEEVPETRNSDITLMIEVWRRMDPDRVARGERMQYVAVADLYKLPREDSVKRMRAYWQNVAKVFLPTVWEVAKQRRIQEDEWLVAMGFPTKDTTGTGKPSWTPPSEQTEKSDNQNTDGTSQED